MQEQQNTTPDEQVPVNFKDIIFNPYLHLIMVIICVCVVYYKDQAYQKDVEVGKNYIQWQRERFEKINKFAVQLPSNQFKDSIIMILNQQYKLKEEQIIQEVLDSVPAFSYELSDELLLNPNFDDSSSWNLLNGTTISNGVANITAGSGGGNGSIGYTGGNWSLNQNVFPETGAGVFLCTYKIRQTVGTGDFQVGNGYHTFFRGPVSSNWEIRQVLITKHEESNKRAEITMGAYDPGDQFELDYISLKEIKNWDWNSYEKVLNAAGVGAEDRNSNGWVDATGVMVYVDTDANNSEYSIAAENSIGTGYRAAKMSREVIIGKEYELKFDYKQSGLPLQCGLYNSTGANGGGGSMSAASVIFNVQDQWVSKTVKMVPFATTLDIQFYINNPDTGADSPIGSKVLIDNVEFKEVENQNENLYTVYNCINALENTSSLNGIGSSGATISEWRMEDPFMPYGNRALRVSGGVNDYASVSVAFAETGYYEISFYAKGNGKITGNNGFVDVPLSGDWVKYSRVINKTEATIDSNIYANGDSYINGFQIKKYHEDPFRIDGLLAYYDAEFSKNPDNDILMGLYDLSGRSNHMGAVKTSPLVKPTIHVASDGVREVSHDGNSGFEAYDFFSDLELDPNVDEFTIVAIIGEQGHTGTNNYLMQKGSNGSSVNQTQYGFRMDGVDRVRVNLGGEEPSTGYTYPVQAQNIFIATSTPANANLFVNGSGVRSLDPGIYVNPDRKFRIATRGSSVQTVSLGFVGSWRKMAIYNRVLTQAEIDAIQAGSLVPTI